MIYGVVLAAGRSRRMGMPKPLLRFGSTCFLERIVTVLGRSRVDRVLVVLGSGAERITAAIDLSAAEVVINDHYEDGQLSSLITAIEHLPPVTEALVLCLVDNPFVQPETVDTLVDTFRRTGRPIVIPRTRGRRGHPALFGRAVFEELRQAPLDRGARAVVRADAGRVVCVDLPDDAVEARIDTPGQYRACFGIAPSCCDQPAGQDDGTALD